MLSVQPLGDQAAMATFGDEAGALHFAAQVRRRAPSWLVDVVQAYAAVAIHFDLDATSFPSVADSLRRLASKPAPAETSSERLHQIPCCYEMQLDLDRVARHVSVAPEEVIRLHTATEYTVYAIGFCPGFPYLGYLPTPLCGVPRLEAPRLRVEPGSVGLTGRQTGIYPETRPGGWNLIGRTPLQLVDVADGYFPLRTGDRVRFVRIDDRRFRQLKGERLQEE
jgi:inhibitor of KinA